MIDEESLIFGGDADVDEFDAVYGDAPFESAFSSLRLVDEPKVGSGRRAKGRTKGTERDKDDGDDVHDDARDEDDGDDAHDDARASSREPTAAASASTIPHALRSLFSMAHSSIAWDEDAQRTGGSVTAAEAMDVVYMTPKSAQSEDFALIAPMQTMDDDGDFSFVGSATMPDDGDGNVSE